MCLRLFLEVKSCSKELLAPIARYGKSPCFSSMGFLLVVSPDRRHYNLGNVDGVDFLECAF
jgi:hypothetical protein